MTSLYTTFLVLVCVCSFCRGQHADVSIWSIPLFCHFSGVAKNQPLLLYFRRLLVASLLILGYDATASSNQCSTNVKKGGRVACVLCLYLFNILAEMVMRETLDGFQGGLQIGWWMLTNLPYADDIILSATLEAELKELVDHLHWVSHKYSLHVNVDKAKVMASDGIACLILIQNEQLKQLDTFLYPGYLNTEDGEYITAFCTRLNRGQAIGESLQKIWKSHSIPISTKIRLLKALVWPVATCGCESWTLRQNEQTHLMRLVWKD